MSVHESFSFIYQDTVYELSEVNVVVVCSYVHSPTYWSLFDNFELKWCEIRKFNNLLLFYYALNLY